MPLLSRRSLLPLLGIFFFTHYVNAQTPLQDAGTNYLKKRADSLMTITGYSLTLDVTTGNLNIKNGSSNRSDLQMTSLVVSVHKT